jgi:uncharacterized OB-fold protein
MIEFEEGGRFMADFTDCDEVTVKVGQPVATEFLQAPFDRERGFSGYFLEGGAGYYIG